MRFLDWNTYGKKSISETKQLGTDLNFEVLEYEIILLRLRSSQILMARSQSPKLSS